MRPPSPSSFSSLLPSPGITRARLSPARQQPAPPSNKKRKVTSLIWPVLLGRGGHFPPQQQQQSRSHLLAASTTAQREREREGGRQRARPGGAERGDSPAQAPRRLHASGLQRRLSSLGHSAPRAGAPGAVGAPQGHGVLRLRRASAAPLPPFPVPPNGCFCLLHTAHSSGQPVTRSAGGAAAAAASSGPSADGRGGGEGRVGFCEVTVAVGCFLSQALSAPFHLGRPRTSLEKHAGEFAGCSTTGPSEDGWRRGRLPVKLPALSPKGRDAENAQPFGGTFLDR